MRAFNSLYYRVNRAGSQRSTKHYQPFFYPLDSAAGVEPPLWSARLLSVPVRRAHGESGGGCPRAAAGDRCVAARVLPVGPEDIRRPRPAVGMLSFPMAGTTLALDFPNLGAPTMALLRAPVRDRRRRRTAGSIPPRTRSCLAASCCTAIRSGKTSRAFATRASRRRCHVACRSLKGVMPQRILSSAPPRPSPTRISRRYAAAHASIVLVGRRAGARGRTPAICAFAARPVRVALLDATTTTATQT